MRKVTRWGNPTRTRPVGLVNVIHSLADNTRSKSWVNTAKDKGEFKVLECCYFANKLEPSREIVPLPALRLMQSCQEKFTS